MSIAVTMFVALARLGLLRNKAGAVRPEHSPSSRREGRRKLVLHIAGADWSEGRSVEVWVPACCSLDRVHISLISFLPLCSHQETAARFVELLYLLRNCPWVRKVVIVLVGPHIDGRLAATTARLPPEGTLPGLDIVYRSAPYQDQGRRVATARLADRPSPRQPPLPLCLQARRRHCVSRPTHQQ